MQDLEIVRRIGMILKSFDQAIQLATGADQRTKISERLAHIIELLLRSGYCELVQEYVQRLRSVGVQVEIKAP